MRPWANARKNAGSIAGLCHYTLPNIALKLNDISFVHRSGALQNNGGAYC